MAVAKRQCLIIKRFCSDELIVPQDGQEYAELINIQKNDPATMRAMFPGERTPKAEVHHTFEMLWKDPERKEYVDNVRKFHTDDSTPEHICEIPVEGSTIETLKMAQKWIRQAPNAKARDLSKALDTRNGLSFEEFELALAGKAPKVTKS